MEAGTRAVKAGSLVATSASSSARCVSDVRAALCSLSAARRRGLSLRVQLRAAAASILPVGGCRRRRLSLLYCFVLFLLWRAFAYAESLR